MYEESVLVKIAFMDTINLEKHTKRPRQLEKHIHTDRHRQTGTDKHADTDTRIHTQRDT